MGLFLVAATMGASREPHAVTIVSETPCARCQSEHGRCAAHTRLGRPCKGAPLTGLNKCRLHIGMSLEAARKAGKQALVLIEARKAMVVLGLPVTGLDPFDALLEEIARTAGHVRWLQALLQGLKPEELVWGRTSKEHSVGDDPKGNYQVVKHEAAPSIWMDLYQKERAHLTNVCKVAIGAGIAERQVKLAEEQGEMIVKILKATLGDPRLGLSVEQQEAAKHVVGAHLRVLTGSEATE